MNVYYCKQQTVNIGIGRISLESDNKVKNPSATHEIVFSHCANGCNKNIKIPTFNVFANTYSCNNFLS